MEKMNRKMEEMVKMLQTGKWLEKDKCGAKENVGKGENRNSVFFVRLENRWRP